MELGAGTGYTRYVYVSVYSCCNVSAYRKSLISQLNNNMLFINK